MTDSSSPDNSSAPDIWAIIPAAGIGSRMQSEMPKQYLSIGGYTILELTINKILALPVVEGVVVVLGENDEYWDRCRLSSHPSIHRVIGGAERCDSVFNGLQYCQNTLKERYDDAWALVHDAARPCVAIEKIQQLIATGLDGYQQKQCDGAILATPVADTVKRITRGNTIEKTEDRSQLWSAHTPQFFPMNVLMRALNTCKQSQTPVTDEASAVEAVGGCVSVVPDRRDNIKITVPEDLAWAENILKQQEGVS